MLQNKFRTSESVCYKSSHVTLSESENSEKNNTANMWEMFITLLLHHINSSHVTLVSSIVTYYVMVTAACDLTSVTPVQVRWPEVAFAKKKKKKSFVTVWGILKTTFSLKANI